MPNLPISQLPAAGSLTGTELFAVVQDGVTKYVPLSSVVTSLTSNYGLFNQTGSSTPVLGTDPTGSLLDGGIGTLSIPANGFNKGDAFHVMMSGKLSAVQNHQLEISIESDGIILANTGTITMPIVSDKNWRLDINFSINEIGGAGTAEIASSGVFTFRENPAGTVVTEIFSTINNTTFDTTINNTLVIKAIWSNSNASDSIYSQTFTLHKIY
jgi:hypothetical protein